MGSDDDQKDASPSKMSPEDRMAKMMECVTEALVAMRNMQKDNQVMNQQLLEMTREKMSMSSIADSPSMAPKNTVRLKPTRPKIDAQMDEIEWKIFLDEWDRYKRRAELVDEEQIRLELRDTCSSDINRLLYQFIGAEELNDDELSEIKLLEHIRNVAVKVEHKEVHRLSFSRMKQNEGETASKYVGRLKAKASLCDFKIKCNCDRNVSYASDMVSQQLVSGLSNPEHQAKVMAEAKSLTSLQEKVEKVMSLEAADDAADKIRQPPKVLAAPLRQSLYKQKKMHKVGKFPAKEKRQATERRLPKCRGCGKSSHGEGKRMFRTDCPAYGKKCNGCGKENHFEDVCEQRKKSKVMFMLMDEEDSSMEQSESDDSSSYADIEGFFDSDHEAESHSVNGATRLLGGSDFRDASRHRVPP